MSYIGYSNWATAALGKLIEGDEGFVSMIVDDFIGFADQGMSYEDAVGEVDLMLEGMMDEEYERAYDSLSELGRIMLMTPGEIPLDIKYHEISWKIVPKGSYEQMLIDAREMESESLRSAMSSSYQRGRTAVGNVGTRTKAATTKAKSKAKPKTKPKANPKVSASRKSKGGC